MKSTAVLEPIRGQRKRQTQPTSRFADRVAPGPDPLDRIEKIIHGLLGSGHGPRVTFVYEDNETRDWAKALHQRIAKIAGGEGIRASWWKISELSAPGILAGAVSSAVHADVIVIASRGEGLPLPFYVWVNLWWPHRPESAGTLVALVGRPEPKAPQVGAVGEYLSVIAHQTRMSFLKAEKGVHRVMQQKSVTSTNSCNGYNGKHHLNGERHLNGVH